MEQPVTHNTASEPVPAYPTLKESWGAVGWYLLMVVLLVLAVLLPSEAIGHLTSLGKTVLGLSLTVAANGLLVLWLRRRAGPGRWLALQWQQPHRPWAVVGLLLPATLSLAMVLSAQQLLRLPRWSASKWLPVVVEHPVVALLFGCLLAPLGEELIFRGVLLRGLLRNYRPAVAIGQSALLFGLVHVSPAPMLNAFLIGLVLGWLYYRSQSLWLGIGLHSLYNMLAFASRMPCWQIYVRYLQRMTSWPAYVLGWLVAALVLAASLAALARSQQGAPATGQ